LPATLSLHDALPISPDGQTVLTASWDWTARLWEANTGKPIGSPMQHSSTVRAAAFSPDGTKIITGAGSLDKTARIWDPRTGGLRSEEHTSELQSPDQ